MVENYNPNPRGKRVGDCVVRALSKALDRSWNDTYISLCIEGYLQGDLPSANTVWDRFLLKQGYSRAIIPRECPVCYSVEDFAEDHPTGRYVVGTGTHAVAVIDGVIYDAWESSDEQPIYYYRKEE